VVASSSEGAWHTASSTSPSTGYDISPEAFVCGHGDGRCRWRSWGGVAGVWQVMVDVGGWRSRQLFVVAGRGPGADGRMVAVLGGAALPVSPSTWWL
jgi:hypothetical protein